MKYPLVSICIPAYNAEKYIKETLDSVMKQTYTNWELIVVEDATMDGTSDIVNEFKQKVIQNVFFFRNEATKGPSGTRNIAVRNSKGEWIAFLDSDDLWHKDHLNELITIAREKTNVEIIHSDVDVFDSQSGKVIYSQSLTYEAISKFPESLFDRTYGFQTSQVMMSRRLFDLMGGFNENIKYGEDLDLWFRCAKAGFEFALSKKHTCLYRKHTEALTANYLEMAVSMAKVYDSHKDWTSISEKLRKKTASDAWFSAARIARKRNRALAKDCLSMSIKYRYSLKRVFYFFLFRIPV